MTEESGGECLLVTADKDCRQLITDRVRLLQHPQERRPCDRDALMDDWGVRPDQVVDFQTLVGDPVDNIPGVPLIGPKLARELLDKVRHAGRRLRPHRRSHQASARKTSSTAASKP